MHTTIQRIGNSKGLIIPKNLLDSFSLNERDVVELMTTEQGIFIKPLIQEYISLDDLFDNYEGDYKCTEFDFGEDVGREKVW